MFIICAIIIIWAIADGSTTALLAVLGGLLLLGVVASNPELLFFILLIAFLFLIFYSLNNSDRNDMDKKTSTSKDDNIIEYRYNTNDEDKIIEKNKEIKNKIQITNLKNNTKEIVDNDNKQDKFLEYMRLLKEKDVHDEDYIKIIYNIGILYEKLYEDYFRAACYIYLCTIHDDKNKDYEKDYIRLCDKLTKEKGNTWTYYVTLVNNLDDIEKYNNELLYQSFNLPTSNNKTKFTKNNISSRNQKKSIHFSDKESKFENFNTESYLHSLGYKVGKTGLSKDQRKKLLIKAVNSGKISKYDIIETLERNISMFHNRLNMKQAIKDWNDDLFFVKNVL